MPDVPPGPGAASPLSIFSDQIDTTRAVRALAGADRRRPSRDLAAADPGTLREKTPRFLLYRHAAKPCLQPQALGDLVVEVANDDRRHGASVTC